MEQEQQPTYEELLGRINNLYEKVRIYYEKENEELSIFSKKLGEIKLLYGRHLENIKLEERSILEGKLEQLTRGIDDFLHALYAERFNKIKQIVKKR